MFLIRYLAAICYDAIIILVLLFSLTVLLLIFNQGHAIPPSTLWYQLSLIGTAFLYYHGSIRFGGQTLGMKAWRFKLTSVDQKSLSNKQILLRILYFIPALFLAPLHIKSSYNLLNQWTRTDLITI
ncbi:RDD family protein [Legionella bononiensis]|uniref:RDD family protein n=1 Tax=Legionella bononiensis TaxID=2793102 RepID=A0ABS1W9N1_9GAMM|nr:RDD family protein [Legionella bononiensis]MBL7480734.1 RDD family protein [Legionella bononiensis]MBL7526067.1 RDD family protein [Legionella bononiensis]MBL7563438.1 RDD family protein [Legionella bononiensis]